MSNDDVGEGTVVRHRRHRSIGTVVRRDGDKLHVAWHDSCVEDELHVDDVEVVPDPTPEQRAWRGGVLILDTTTSTVVSLRDAAPWTDLGWTESDEGVWTSRHIEVRPPGSAKTVADHVTGHIVEASDSAGWFVTYTTAVAEPGRRTIRDGRAETVDAAKQAVADVIRDVLAL